MKNKGLEYQVQELYEYYDKKEYEELLKKVLKSNNCEAMYLIAKYFEDAPIDLLESRMYQIDFNAKKVQQNLDWKIKINNLSHDENYVKKIWLEIRQIIISYHNYYSNWVDLNAIMDDINLLAILDNAPVDEIYSFLKEKDLDVISFLHTNINLNLDLIVDQINDPYDLYSFVLNYREHINDEYLIKFINKFMDMIRYFYNKGYQHRFYHYREEMLKLYYKFIETIPNLKHEHYQLLIGDPFLQERKIINWEETYYNTTRKMEDALEIANLRAKEYKANIINEHPHLGMAYSDYFDNIERKIKLKQK